MQAPFKLSLVIAMLCYFFLLLSSQQVEFVTAVHLWLCAVYVAVRDVQ